MCILNFGACSVFEFLAYEGMNGTTDLAVVDLSPYGFVFKKFAFQFFMFPTNDVSMLKAVYFQ